MQLAAAHCLLEEDTANNSALSWCACAAEGFLGTCAMLLGG